MSASPVPAALAAACVDAWVRLSARRPLAYPATPAGVAEEGDAPPSPSPSAHRLLLVDGFAGTERAGVRGRLGGARASAAVAALAAAARRERLAVPVEAAAVLADEDPAQLAAVRDVLASQTETDVAGGAAPRFSAAGAGVSLAEGRFAEMVGDLAGAADGQARSLWLLAPPSAGALPWEALRPLLSLDGADVLLAFPAADAHRHALYADTPFADLPGHVRRAVAGVSALLGDGRHAWLAAWRRATAEGGAPAAEIRLAAVWGERIAGEAPGRVVKPLRVDGGGDAGRLHLLLVTADPSLPLAMNGALRDLGIENEAAEAAPRVAPPAADAAVLELFAAEEMGAAPPAAAELPVDAAALAETIVARHRGGTVPYAAVLRAFAPTDATADDVRRAMSLLKRQGRARFRSLADDTAEVEFPVEAVPPLRRAPLARPLPIAADTAAGPLFDAPRISPLPIAAPASDDPAPSRISSPQPAAPESTSRASDEREVAGEAEEAVSRATGKVEAVASLSADEEKATGNAGAVASPQPQRRGNEGGRPPRKEDARRPARGRRQPSGS
jgi:hypothetical protein